MHFVLWLAAVLITLFIGYRLYRSGTRVKWQGLFRRDVVLGALLLTGAVAASGFAARTLRRPGSTTFVEALSDDMSAMRAPVATGPVVLVMVERGQVQGSVRYSGTAVGYVEQEIFPRVTGTLLWMPFYAGDRIRKGQLLAKLDSREYQSRMDERSAGREMAEQMTGISRLEYQQALASAAQGTAEARSKEGALEEARRMHSRAQAMLRESQSGVAEGRDEVRAMQADLAAAEQEREEVGAMLETSRSMLPDAEAMLAAMKADQEYWSKEISRMKVLLDKGAVSGEEFQREEAMAKGADAKVRQAEAKVQSAQSEIRAARARVAKVEAMVRSAEAKVAQARSRLSGMEARVEQAQAEVAAATGRIQMAEGDVDAARANARAMRSMANAGAGKIRQAQAGARQAAAALTTAAVVRGYTEIRSEVDGVITQRLLAAGTLVNPGQAILKVAQIDPIRVQASVPDADLSRLRVGSRVSVRFRSGSPAATAVVSSISPAMDPVTRTGVVEALIPNPRHKVLPGQYLAIDLSTGAGSNAVRVPSTAVRWESTPSSAILSTQQRAYVWLAEPTSEGSIYVVRRVPVTPGESNGEFTEIRGGIEPGQQVVARGHDDLSPGQKVVSVPWGADGPNSLPPAGEGSHAGHQRGGQTGVRQPPAGTASNAPEDHSGHGGRAGHGGASQ